MEEYIIEAIQSCLTKLKVSIDPARATSSALSIQMTNSLRPPLDPDDPTVLIVSEIEMEDANPEQLKVACELQCIFKMEPIPENRLKVASERCPALIRREALKLVEKALNAMGHPIHFNENL